MISKRWKKISNTGATGDIAFMDKLLADFRKFCNNEENRLVTLLGGGGGPRGAGGAGPCGDQDIQTLHPYHTVLH